MSTNRVLCKFFMHGACLKGEHCEFSHDWRDPENNICTFYQKGECSFGSRCRYEHVKPCRSEAKDLVLPAPFSSSPSSPCAPSGLTTTCISNYPSSSSYQMEVNPVLRHQDQLSAQSEPFVPLARAVWTYDSGEALPGDQDTTHNYAFVSKADIPICSFAAAGTCPRGTNCPHIHGDLCQTCGKHCLHPYRPDEVNAHIKQCQRNQKYLEALRQSQEIECSVCMELVLLKPRTAERKFGLLSECDHPFCISCIRNWRGSSPVSGIDVNGAVRACPVCRKLSYFVIPSVIWYSSKEEKEEIVDSYKAKLSSIDCRYFDFGNGNCPFGTSCFYKHAYRDGRLEEKTLRHLGAEDGLTVIAKDIRLSDFFRGLHL